MRSLRRVVTIILILLLGSMFVACNGNGEDPIEEEPTLYTITFESNGGSEVAPISKQAGEKITAPQAPTRTGFTFAGWREENSNFAPYYVFDSMPERSFTLYADWDTQFFTVIFDIGEDAEIQSGGLVQMIPYQGNAALPTCKRTGYDLIGWEGNYTNITQDTTISAIWQIQTFTVIFDPNCDDAILESGEATQTIEYGGKAIPPVFTREGYTFVGWSYYNEWNDVKENITFTAFWRTKYLVTFNGGEGGVLESGEEEQLIEDYAPANPPTYTRYGYTFSGWILVPEYANLEHVVHDITATARWMINSYSVFFESGHEDAVYHYGQEEQTIKHGHAVEYPPKYTLDGYVFIGWSLQPEDTDLTDVQCDITATAEWQEGYLVTFELAEGTLIDGEIEQIIEYGQDAIPPILEKEGYYYSWDSSYKNITGTITITAVWYTPGLEFEQWGNGYSVKGTMALSAQEVLIPSAYNGELVVAIADHAFENMTFITDISIPHGVENIGNKAFMGCTGLTSITLPFIRGAGEYAFANCTNLTEWTIDSSSYFIILEKGVFSGCSSLQSIYLSHLDRIKEYAFQNCTSLTEVIIPNPDSRAFSTIDNFAFVGCESLQSFTIPTLIQSNGLGEGVFSGCSSLTAITLPDRITIVKDNLFTNCSNLTSVTMGSVTSIGKNAFSGCANLLLTIPSSVASIGESAFSGCAKLEDIDISNVTSLGVYAFKNCKKIASLTLSADITAIVEGVFMGCKDLQAITMLGNITSIDKNSFAGCSSLEAITIPNSVESIGEGAFAGCSSLEVVVIPNSVESIGASAFSGCSSLVQMSLPFIGANLAAQEREALFGYIFGAEEYLGGELLWQEYLKPEQDYPSSVKTCLPISLKEVAITNISSVPSGAFSACKYLTDITIPEGITSIGGYAFKGCSSLEQFDIPQGITEIRDHVFRGCESITELVLPEGITAIGEGAFMSCAFEDIAIPSGVSTIGEGAFGFCVNLIEIALPEGVTIINDSTFYGCSSLSSITILGVITEIGNSAFYDCTSLEEFNIPITVTSIGHSAFAGCSGLIEIEIPYGITEIAHTMFSGCTALESITLPDTLTEIGGIAFQNCSSLTSISLANSITSIGYSAFSGCSSLTEIMLPNQITEIAEYLLSGVELELLIIPDLVTTIKDHSLNNVKNIVLPISITDIRMFALASVEIIYYKGDSVDWGNININENAFYSTPDIYYYSESQIEGYWHFDSQGIPEIWE